ncbi:MAG: Gfo/Idh/MocA family oxidoreductase [Ruminococcus sp.]|nr:Gfo/Idh/MocA family oxidoreductase [Ruminococcus sp.]
MNIGIIGAGTIAHKMAETVTKSGIANMYAIASRSIDKAREFAAIYNIPKAYGSYEEIAADSDIDLIYIATPHSRHYEDCMLCIENGRNVLCEKAFTANAIQAKKLLEFAKEKNVFITEAIWTRYIPMRFVLDEILESGIIGEISSLTANLGYDLSMLDRLQLPELAGGALLDLGVYTLNFAVMAFGKDIAQIKSTCTLNKHGVDMNNSIIIKYKDGKTALLHSNFNAKTDRMGIIYGSKGRIEFKNINNCEGIKVILNNDEVIDYPVPPQVSGYEYEVISSLKAIKENRLECDEMPHSETIFIMELMDSLRKEWGIKYPFE